MTPRTSRLYTFERSSVGLLAGVCVCARVDVCVRESEGVVCVCVRTNARTSLAPFGLLAGLFCIPSPCVYYDACQAFHNLYPTVLKCARTTPSYKGLCSLSDCALALHRAARCFLSLWSLASLVVCARFISVCTHTLHIRNTADPPSTSKRSLATSSTAGTPRETPVQDQNGKRLTGAKRRLSQLSSPPATPERLEVRLFVPRTDVKCTETCRRPRARAGAAATEQALIHRSRSLSLISLVGCTARRVWPLACAVAAEEIRRAPVILSSRLPAAGSSRRCYRRDARISYLPGDGSAGARVVPSVHLQAAYGASGKTRTRTHTHPTTTDNIYSVHTSSIRISGFLGLHKVANTIYIRTYSLHTCQLEFPKKVSH